MLKTAYKAPPVSMGVPPAAYRRPDDIVLPCAGIGPQAVEHREILDPARGLDQQVLPGQDRGARTVQAARKICEIAAGPG